MTAKTKAKALVLSICGAASVIICLGKWGMSGRSFTACMFLLFLTVAAREDVRTKRIPNRMVIGAGTAGMLSVLFFPEVSIGSRGIGMLGVSLLLLIITLIVPGSFGGGDIKLMTASGIFLGWEYNLRAFVLAVFTAGVYCSWMLLRGKMNRKDHIAFGPFLCAGIMAEVIGSL